MLERKPTLPEVDDFNHALNIAVELNLTMEACKFFCLAQWLATLREYYVQIGKDTASGPKGARELLEWMDRKGGLGYDVHDRIRKVLGKPKQFD